MMSDPLTSFDIYPTLQRPFMRSIEYVVRQALKFSGKTLSSCDNPAVALDTTSHNTASEQRLCQSQILYSPYKVHPPRTWTPSPTRGDISLNACLSRRQGNEPLTRNMSDGLSNLR